MKSRGLVLKLILFLSLNALAGNALAQIQLVEIDWEVAGGDVFFVFRVLNSGDVNLTNVSVDTGNVGVNQALPLPTASLGAGQEVLIASEYAVTNADRAAGQIVLNAPYAFGDVFACEFNCRVESPPLADVVIPIGSPDLSVNKQVSDDLVEVGRRFIYTITVSNVGTETALGVVMEDTLPAGLTLLGTSGAECNASNPVLCFIDDLLPGDSQVISLEVSANEGTKGLIVNQACADDENFLNQPQAAANRPSPQFDPNPSNDCDTAETTIFEDDANLSIRKSDNVDPVAVGDQFDYIIEVSNAGPGAATNVVVSDTLPDEVTFVETTCENGNGADCTIGALAANASFTYRVTVSVNAGASGTIRNTATVSTDTFDRQPSNNSNSESTEILSEELEADLSISKSVSPVGPVAIGSQLVYTISVANNGPAAAVNVVAFDNLPAGVTLDSSVCPGGDSVDSCAFGALEPGQTSAPWTITATVDEAAAGLTLTNTASVASDTLDSNQGNNSALVSNPVQDPATTATFTVLKDFSDDSSAAVQVALSCINAEVDQPTRSASESAPAVFNLSGVGPETRCTATEPQVPEGYVANNSSCINVAVGSEVGADCTIYNDKLPDETTITVRVSLDDPNAQVEVTLECNDATIEDATQPASNDSPAVFKLSDVGAGNTCNATISGAPDGSLTDTSSCEDLTVEEGGQNECQINNVELPPTGLPPESPATDTFGTIVDTCPTGDNEGGFQELCNGLLAALVTGDDVTDALFEITPDEASTVSQTGKQTTNVQVMAVDGRLGTLRGGGGAGFSASGFSMALGDFAVSGSLLKSFMAAIDQNNPDFAQANAGQNDSGYLDEFGLWGIWVSGRLVLGEKDRTINQFEYDFKTAGLTFGMDYRFSDNLVAGLAVGYADTNTDLGVDDGDVDTSGYSMSLYGTWFQADRFYLAGSLGYGSNDYDQERVLRYRLTPPDGAPPQNAVFDVEQTLVAEFSGSQYSAVISGGWDFNRNGWTFGPTARIAYVDVDVDGYNETLFQSNVDFGEGAVGWAVQIDDQSYSSLQPSLGFEFSNAISRGWGILIPQGYIEVVSELEDGAKIVTGRFLGDLLENNDFALPTDDFEETFARAGLGLGFILPKNKSAFITVDADMGRDVLTTYYINAGFRWQF